MQIASQLTQSDIRALMQIVTTALEHESSARIVIRELCLSEEDIDRLYELADETRKNWRKF
jgi:methylaspartate ammonia-lyase